ncbi:MAG: hypothetical protein AAF447_17505, partial [Myxococcota bacterium]
MMGLVCGSAEGIGFGDAPVRPEAPLGPRRRIPRAWLRLGLAAALTTGLAAGCGGSQRETTLTALPPADPAAVREFVSVRRDAGIHTS